MQDNKRGIGDNSIQDDKYKNFAEHIKDISSRLWKLHSTISSTINTHSGFLFLTATKFPKNIFQT